MSSERRDAGRGACVNARSGVVRRPGAVGTGRVAPIGLYWDREVWVQARSAFVSDLDHSPGEPAETFIDWLHAAIRTRAALSPADRARVVVPATPVQEWGQSQGISRMSPLEVELVVAVDEAIVADRRHRNRLCSRSAFVQDAVLVAIEAARARHPAGHLELVTGRLPNNPVRRHGRGVSARSGAVQA